MQAKCSIYLTVNNIRVGV